MTHKTHLLLPATAFVLPLVLLGFSGSNPASPNPPVKRTGAFDGGLTCTQCHTGTELNSPGGFVRIETSGYRPGVKQTIKVTVSHPAAQRWGFELSARPVSSPDKMAGSFSSSNANAQVVCDDGSLRGHPGPCTNGALEFATHTGTGNTAAKTGDGTATFEIDWTPPSDDVGDILLGAAGNAANGNGNNQGDRIYNTTLRIHNEGACSALISRPTVRSIVNGASFQPGMSVNAMFSVMGSGFAAGGVKRQAGSGDFQDGKFPGELSCLAVEVNGQRAPISYVQNDQINAQAPTISDVGPVRVQVIVNPGRPGELRSDMATVDMQRYTPAFFTLDGRTIAAQFANSTTLVADPSAFPGSRQAKPGDIVVLYGTGFGVTDPVYQAGELPGGQARLRDPFTVTIGGVTLAAADILYAGLSPGSISGLYQFNLRVPSSVSDGDLPVVVEMGGARTTTATLPVKR